MANSMEVVRKIEVPDLSERIKSAREADGRSVQILATMAGISSAYWYQLENGTRKWVSEEVIRKIESALEIDFGVRFDEHPEVQPRTLVLREKS